MENFRAPSREDLQAYRVLINFLQQVRSHLEGINEETERFTKLLQEQKNALEEQNCALQDFSSSLSDYEEDTERLCAALKKGKSVINRQKEVEEADHA